jgi:hypothetical protein
MTLIDLNDDEMKIVEALSQDKGITINEAAQQIFDAGKEKLLEDASPSTMALSRVLRASKSAALKLHGAA